MAKPNDETNATPSANEGDELTKVKEELKESKGQVADLTSKVSDLQGTIISPQYQEYMKAQNQPPPQTFQPTDFAAGRTNEGDLDLEGLDRKQLIQVILGEVEKRMAPRIDQVSQNVRQDQLHRSIKETRGKYTDFDNHKTAMGKLAARIEAGGLTADDVYKLATWKASLEDETDKGKKTIVSEKPTTGGNAPTDTKKLTLAEKASKVWDDLGVDEKHPRTEQ